MSKRLVAYFSASGVTARVAENLADAIGQQSAKAGCSAAALYGTPHRLQGGL